MSWPRQYTTHATIDPAIRLATHRRVMTRSTPVHHGQRALSVDLSSPPLLPIRALYSTHLSLPRLPAALPLWLRRLSTTLRLAHLPSPGNLSSQTPPLATRPPFIRYLSFPAWPSARLHTSSTILVLFPVAWLAISSLTLILCHSRCILSPYEDIQDAYCGPPHARPCQGCLVSARHVDDCHYPTHLFPVSPSFESCLISRR